jgi:hypothetical protein
MTTAAEALGLGPEAIVVNLTCDELGFSYGANAAIY